MNDDNRTDIDIDISEILRNINTLTNQRDVLAHKILLLKRKVAGHKVPVMAAFEPIPSPAPETPGPSSEKKRSRGRPKKNMILTSILPQMQTQTQVHGNNGDGDGDGGGGSGDGRIRDIVNKPAPENMVYVIENNDLFIRNDNGMLFDIESREVVGWYNPYAPIGNVDWLYK